MRHKYTHHILGEAGSYTNREKLNEIKIKFLGKSKQKVKEVTEILKEKQSRAGKFGNILLSRNWFRRGKTTHKWQHGYIHTGLCT